MTMKFVAIQRKPLPPFNHLSALEKVRMAENAWNSRNAQNVSMAYTVDSKWRNRGAFLNGRVEIIEFLTEKWARETDYRLIKELWTYSENRIAVRFVYEWRDLDDNWFRSHGNENWKFDKDGLMSERHASINDVSISAEDRLFLWPAGPRPIEHAGLSELGL